MRKKTIENGQPERRVNFQSNRSVCERNSFFARFAVYVFLPPRAGPDSNFTAKAESTYVVLHVFGICTCFRAGFTILSKMYHFVDSLYIYFEKDYIYFEKTCIYIRVPMAKRDCRPFQENRRAEWFTRNGSSKQEQIWLSE